MIEKTLPPERLYLSIINSKPYTFWGNPSVEGLDMMKDAKQLLNDNFKPGELYSGNVHQTFTVVSQMLDVLNRRIERWSVILKSAQG